MSAFAAFILGVLVGWLIEWIIDWFFWRKQKAQLRAELEQCKTEVKTLQSTNQDLTAQLAAVKDTHADVQVKDTGLDVEKAELQSKLAALEADKAALSAQVDALQSALDACQTEKSALANMPPAFEPTRAQAIAIEPDDLKVIKGIGPVISKKLNEAGIYTFAELGQLTVDRLRELVGDSISRLADEESLLEQARQLAAAKAQGK